MEQHFPYLFWGYNIIWILIGGYVLMLGFRLKKVQKQIDRMKKPGM